MLVVISSPDSIENEAKIINELFENGMELFHLRKPNSIKNEVAELINNIKPEFYKNISLHQFHELANDFGIKRLHFKSIEREKANFVSQKFIKTCSIHSVEEYNKLPNNIFEYCFLSPVFDSISKSDYKQEKFDLSKIDKTKITKLIALGGISAENLNEAMKLGFDGVGVLGSVWRKNPLEEFLEIKENC